MSLVATSAKVTSQELLCSPVSRFCSSMLCLNVNKFTFSNAKLKKPSSPQVGGCDNLMSNTGSLLPSIDFLPMLATFWERNQNSILVGQKLPTITNNSRGWHNALGVMGHSLSSSYCWCWKAWTPIRNLKFYFAIISRLNLEPGSAEVEE